MLKVVNVRNGAYCDLYIGRKMPGREGSPLGNPFKVAKGEDPGSSLEKYKTHLWDAIKRGDIKITHVLAVFALMSTQSKTHTLGCWCKPAPCHGDIIVDCVAWIVANVDCTGCNVNKVAMAMTLAAMNHNSK